MEVTDYIPQRRPFVFVDGLLSFDGKVSHTMFRVREDTLFVRDGVFAAAGIVEFVAQSCALRMGYEDRLRGINDVRPGMIGALSSMSFGPAVHVGDRLECVLEIEGEYEGMLLVSASVFRDDVRVAEGSMKIVRKGDLL